jgi:hypothetical protein
MKRNYGTFSGKNFFGYLNGTDRERERVCLHAWAHACVCAHVQ